MNRRSFCFFGMSFLSALAFPILGCGKQTIAQLVQTLGSATAQLATLLGNTALSQKIQTDTTAAVAAINNWQNGSPVQLVVQALNLVMDDLNLIPAAGPYAAWIDLAIVTVEAILAMIPAPVPAGVSVAKITAAPKDSKAFKKQWNHLVDINPGVAVPKI